MSIKAIEVRKSLSINVSNAEWQKFEKGNAVNIFSKDLNPQGVLKNLTIKLMKVQPRGEFPTHFDPYEHFFYLISGTGEAQLGDAVHPIEKGQTIIIEAGVKHGYRNTGSKDMYLLTMNIPNTVS
jgi:quercetin dioxygenase-like cupin family protein